MDFSLSQNNWVGVLAAAFYVASAFILFSKAFLTSANDDTNGSDKREMLAWLLGLTGALLHAAKLFGSTITSSGLNLSFFNSLSVTTWVAVVLTILLNFRRPVINLGLILFPMAAATLVLSLWFSSGSENKFSPGVQWHVLISVVAYALLTIATGQALLVSVQDNRLRNRKTGGLLRALPPLKVMETVLFQLLLVSFLFLTLSLATGFLFLDDMFAQRMVHKTILSVAAWGLIALLLIGHFKWGWRGQKAAGITLGAFISLLLGYFGSKFVIELLLK